MILSRDSMDVLLIKRKNEPFANHWALVGGAKRQGESFADCAIREVEEEVGVRLRTVTRVDYIEVSNELGQQLSVVFVGMIPSHDLDKIRAGEEVLEVGWFPLRDLPTPIVPFHKTAIECWAWKF